MRSTAALGEDRYIGLSRAKEVLDETYLLTWLVRLFWGVGMIGVGGFLNTVQGSTRNYLWLIPCLFMLGAVLIDYSLLKKRKKQQLQKYAVPLPSMLGAVREITKYISDMYRDSSTELSKRDFNLSVASLGMSIQISGGNSGLGRHNF